MGRGPVQRFKQGLGIGLRNALLGNRENVRGEQLGARYDAAIVRVRIKADHDGRNRRAMVEIASLLAARKVLDHDFPGREGRVFGVNKRINHRDDGAFTRPLSANLLDFSSFIFELVRGWKAEHVVVIKGRCWKRVPERIGSVRQAHPRRGPQLLQTCAQAIEPCLFNYPEADFLQDRQIRRPEIKSQYVLVCERIAFVIYEDI